MEGEPPQVCEEKDNDKNANPPQHNRQRVLVLLDGLCAYHSGYLAARAAAMTPPVAVVHVLSDYVRGYLVGLKQDPEQMGKTEKNPENDDDDEDHEVWHDGDRHYAAMPSSIDDAMPAWIEACRARACKRQPQQNPDEPPDSEDVAPTLSTAALPLPPWTAVYCESDSGLADAERLRSYLAVECADMPTMLEARRHKYKQQVVANAAGLAVARQQLCDSVSDAQAFAQKTVWNHHDTAAAAASSSESIAVPRVVVKPVRGVGSESVFLCTSPEDIESAWNAITSSQVFGSAERHTNVLVQEFLEGVEYAVDVVSRNGQHKVAAIWRYDKQPANGASFCYFKTELIDSTSSGSSRESVTAAMPPTDDEQQQQQNCNGVVEDVCRYVEQSLNALGIQWGITHTEVIVPKQAGSKNANECGPKLIEVNCRQHNMDFLPLTMTCIGYNVFDMMLAAMFGEEADWDVYPNRPTLRAFGCMVHLVNYAAKGRLLLNNHLQDMVDLPSVLDCEVYEPFCTPGSFIEPTIDIKSDAGWAHLVNDNAEALQDDYDQIVAWMPDMFVTQLDNE